MQVLQICGAILILVAYALAQMGRMDQAAKPYLLLNLTGSAVLAFRAAQWGFPLLEGAWALISVAA